MPALDARADGAQAPGLSRGSGKDATPTPADVGGPSSAFAEIADVVRRHDVRPVFVAVDNVVDPMAASKVLVKQAERAGFLVFDLYELWKGRDQKSLRIASADNHPNAAGMRIIAEQLFELIQQHRAELRIDTAAAPPSQ